MELVHQHAYRTKLPGDTWAAARRRSREHQPGQHVGLEPLQLLRRRERTARPQVRNGSDSQLAFLAFTSLDEGSNQMRSLQESRGNFNTPSLAQRTRKCTSCGLPRTTGRSNSRVVVL